MNIDRNYEALESIQPVIIETVNPIPSNVQQTPPAISEKDTPDISNPTSVQIPPSVSYQLDTPKSYQPTKMTEYDTPKVQQKKVMSSLRVSRRNPKFYQSDELAASRATCIDLMETCPAWQIKKCLKILQSEEAGSIA